MTVLFNPIWSKERRKDLRRRETKAEKILWELLRDRQMLGIKFRRQYGVGKYILDFYAPQLKLAIEADGHAHENAEAKKYDQLRDQYLQDVGITMKRYKNYEILYGTEIRERLSVFLAPLLSKEGVTGLGR